jgi:GLPGLI family protein
MLVRPILTFAACGLLLAGCGTDLLHPRLAEGTIEYSLSFPDYDPDGLMAGMLPEKTVLSFTEEKQVAEVSAGMGIFKTTMQVDNTDHSMDYHMSMMGKRLVSHLKNGDIALFNGDYGNPTIIYTADVDTVAGYPCKKAVAIFDRINQQEIELWYTDRIKMQDPNWFGPFAEIPGVLMRYDLVQNGIRMHLDAVQVTPGKVDPAKFAKKADHQDVPAGVLQHEIAEVMGAFSM